MTKNNAIRVLLFEDEALVRMATRPNLEDAGIIVLEARNAADAITALENAERITYC